MLAEGHLPWPEGEKGNVLLDVLVDKPVDDAFLLLFSGENELRKRLNEAASNKDYMTTGWLKDAAGLDAALGQAAVPPAVASLTPGLHRKSTYSGMSMGSKFRTDELLKLTEAVPGSHYELQVMVATTATYGDKFRPLLKHTLRAHGEGASSLEIRATLVFISKVNGLIKGMIEKGVRDGMSKNFATFKQVLGGLVTLREAGGAAPPLAAAAGVAAAAAPEAAPLAVPGLLETLVGPDACQRLDPWAAFFHHQLPAVVQSLLDKDVLVVVLAAGLLLLGLRFLVDLLRFVEHASWDPQDSIALLTHYVFKVVDVPDSTQEMVVACLLAYLVRVLVNRLVALLPAPPAAAAPAREGTPSVTSPPTSPEPPHSKSDEHEQEGVKYEGYAEAIAGMQNGLGTLGPSCSSQFNEAMAKETERALLQIKSSFTGLGKQMRALTQSATKAATREGSDVGSPSRVSPAAAGASDAAAKGEHHRKHRHRKHKHKRSRGNDADFDLSAIQEQPGGAAAEAGIGAALDGRAETAAEALGGSSDAEGASGSSRSGNAGASPELSEVGPSLALVSSPPQDAPPGSMSSFTRRLLGFSSPSKQPASPDGEVSTSRTSTAFGGRASLMGDDPTLSAAHLEPRMEADATYLPAHLPPELVKVAVIEEVFENQRLQPFRGWGHSWPGHFLPTDRVSHWTLRETMDERGQLVIRASSQLFNEVAPTLPEGWYWVEDTWHVDVSGVLAQAVDNDGWCYGLDFGYVVYPFATGLGKKKLADFVRRRRWARTRVPLEVPECASVGASASPCKAEPASLQEAMASGSVTGEVETVIEGMLEEVEATVAAPAPAEATPPAEAGAEVGPPAEAVAEVGPEAEEAGKNGSELLQLLLAELQAREGLEVEPSSPSSISKLSSLPTADSLPAVTPPPAEVEPPAAWLPETAAAVADSSHLDAGHFGPSRMLDPRHIDGGQQQHVRSAVADSLPHTTMEAAAATATPECSPAAEDVACVATLTGCTHTADMPITNEGVNGEMELEGGGSSSRDDPAVLLSLGGLPVVPKF